MSYRMSVRDDSRATPYFYSKNNFPVETSRSTYFDVARDALITRKFGGKNPFWVRMLDKNQQIRAKVPWWRKRFIPFYPWFANAPSNTIVQKGNQRSTRFKNRSYKSNICRCNRYGKCRCRPKFGRGQRRSYRSHNKVHRIPARFTKFSKRGRVRTRRYPIQTRKSKQRFSKRRWR